MTIYKEDEPALYAILHQWTTREEIEAEANRMRAEFLKGSGARMASFFFVCTVVS